MKKPNKQWTRRALFLLAVAIYCFSGWMLLGPYVQIETKEYQSRRRAKQFQTQSQPFRDGFAGQQALVDRYLDTLHAQSDAVQRGETTEPAQTSLQSMETELAKELPYGALYAAMARYNQEIFQKGQAGLDSIEAYANPCLDVTAYGLKSDVIGSLWFPTLDVSFPLYLGGSMEHLNAGVAQLSQTSMPIGGVNTNCVVAGHRGWTNGKYLKDIEEISVGEVLKLTTLWEVMDYRVTEIRVIAPNDIDAIKIQPGRDMLTVVTCHPYGNGGLYRYLLLCDRVLEENESAAPTAPADQPTREEVSQQASREPAPAPNASTAANSIKLGAGVVFESSKTMIFWDDLLHYIGFALLFLLPLAYALLSRRSSRRP